MFQTITFRSKVLQAVDYRSIDLSAVTEGFAPDHEALEKELRLLQKQHANKFHPETAAQGDYAVLRCQSELPRFQRDSVTVIVGRGLYSAVLENALIGMSPQQATCVTIDGVPVNVTLLEVTRTVLPELTDENVSQWQLPEVTSVAELRQWLLAKQKAEFRNEQRERLGIYLTSQAAQQSRFQLDEEERLRAREAGRKLALDMIRSQGVDPDTLGDADPVPGAEATKADYLNYVENLSEEGLKEALLGQLLMQETGYAPTEADYEAAIEEQMAYRGLSREETKQAYTPKDYMQTACGNYFYDAALAYAADYLNEEK
jgi:FKBP-type peptidyl-prolyl cis-trans isomerase (trigger factor)